ncbi:MAG TPA: hypothetical protein VG603_10260 [Chitinophagales bacterium]|nr:hypothetical protein [Chitinophagales bacterium]
MKETKTLGLYVLWFLCLFFPLPFLYHSLPGKTDSWFTLWALNTYANHLRAWLTGGYTGDILYPAPSPLTMGNSSAGLFPLYLLLRPVFNVSPVWGMYVLMSVVFGLSAWGAYLLARFFKYSWLAALATGFLFANSNMMFGRMDSLDSASVGTGFIAAYFLLKAFEKSSYTYVLGAVFFSVLTVSLSGDSSIVMALVMLVACLVYAGWFMRPANLPIAGVYAGLCVAAIALFFHWFIAGNTGKLAYNPVDSIRKINYLSLSGADFLRYQPNNLWHSVLQGGTSTWFYNTSSAATGLVCALLALGGLFAKGGKAKVFAIGVTAVGLLLALGPYLVYRPWLQLKSPLYFLFNPQGIGRFLRLPVRFYGAAWLGICFLAVNGLRLVGKRFGLTAALLTALLLLSEEIPLRFGHYTAEEMMSDPAGNFIKQYTQPTDVLLYLPTGLEAFSEKPLPPYRSEDISTREMVYMYWQSLHGRNVLNGYHSFIPYTRIYNQQLIDHLDNPDSLRALVTNNHLSHIIYYKHQVLLEKEKMQLNYLKAAGWQVAAEDENVAIVNIPLTRE